MKTLKKILPLFGAVAVGAIPFATTGCSRVWTDLLEKPYIPSYTPATQTKDGIKEVTMFEAKDIFQNYFLENPNNLIPDFYWGASLFGRKGLPAWDNVEVKTFLMQLSNMTMKKGDESTSLVAPILSYQSKVQLEIKDPGLAGSYAINTYDLDWSFSNIAVIPVHYATLERNECWSLSPVKFDSYNAFWWRELDGNEQIKFDFKAVFKGYGKNGGQNYIRETSEAAIIDEAHKYAPELNEIYTSIMLFDSYYLSQLKPRMIFEDANIRATWNETEKKYKCDELGFTLGSGTFDAYKDCKLKFSILEDSIYPYSPFESGIDVKLEDINLGVSDGKISEIITKPDHSLTFNPSFTISNKKEPLAGDRLYYVIKIECDPSASSNPNLVNWKDYLFVSTLISVL